MWMMMMLALANDHDDEPYYEFDAMPAMRMKLEVAVGGAQDITYFRDRATHGELPLPEVFTPEGLFSEHDLPMPIDSCDRLICVDTVAKKVDLLAQPEVEWLGQIGFGTMLTEGSFQRAPLNLVAVIDKSGSMYAAIEHVKAGLHTMVDQLGPGDQLSIVLYGSEVHTLQAPSGDRRTLHAAIDRIEVSGSTAMEAGLKHGFALARGSRRSFDGTTRVMLFTDERPNVGATEADSFMGMARAASADNIGMTTIGVGTQFGAELATAISSVRGGNLVFFPDGESMQTAMKEHLDEWVTELAYDLEMRIEPAKGAKVAGIYGVPGDMVAFDGDALVVGVETLFLSRNAGAIYVGFGRDDSGLPLRGGPGKITLSYTARDGDVAPRTTTFALTDRPPLGLSRGELLVDQATTLKAAMTAHHHDNDQKRAYQLVHALADRFRGAHDASLAKERELIEALEKTLAEKAGMNEPVRTSSTERHEVNGLPVLVSGG